MREYKPLRGERCELEFRGCWVVGLYLGTDEGGYHWFSPDNEVSPIQFHDPYAIFAEIEK